MPEDNFDEIKEFLGLTESAGGPKIWGKHLKRASAFP